MGGQGTKEQEHGSRTSRTYYGCSFLFRRVPCHTLRSVRRHSSRRDCSHSPPRAAANPTESMQPTERTNLIWAYLQGTAFLPSLIFLFCLSPLLRVCPVLHVMERTATCRSAIDCFLLFQPAPSLPCFPFLSVVSLFCLSLSRSSSASLLPVPLSTPCAPSEAEVSVNVGRVLWEGATCTEWAVLCSKVQFDLQRDEAALLSSPIAASLAADQPQTHRLLAVKLFGS